MGKLLPANLPPVYQCQLEDAMPNSYPWHVSLIKDGVVKCSGAIIHPSWIITSGTCIIRKMTIVAGFSSMKTLPIDVQKGFAQVRRPDWKGARDRNDGMRRSPSGRRPPQYNESNKFIHNLAMIGGSIH